MIALVPLKMKKVSNCSSKNRLIFNLTSAPIQTFNIQTYKMQHCHIEMSEMIFMFVIYFVELCAYIILNVSIYVQTQSNQ